LTYILEVLVVSADYNLHIKLCAIAFPLCVPVASLIMAGILSAAKEWLWSAIETKTTFYSHCKLQSTAILVARQWK
jgi:hypothetical protein